MDTAGFPTLGPVASAMLGGLRDQLVQAKVAELGEEAAGRHADAWLGRTMGLFGRAKLHATGTSEDRRFAEATGALKAQLAGLRIVGVDAATLDELRSAIRGWTAATIAYTAALTLDILPELLANFRQSTPDVGKMES